MEKTKIADLKAGQKNVWIDNCEIVENKGVKDYVIKEKTVKVCDAKIKDDTGEINISAFGDVSKILTESKKINIENCYCKGYQDKLQISTGFYGRIKKIE